MNKPLTERQFSVMKKVFIDGIKRPQVAADRQCKLVTINRHIYDASKRLGVKGGGAALHNAFIAYHKMHTSAIRTSTNDKKAKSTQFVQ